MDLRSEATIPAPAWSRVGQEAEDRVHGSGDAQTFDAKTRDTVRRKLLAYMQQHAIGVVRLAARVSEANPRNPEIPIKTLQRFLAGRMRTSDIYVGFFHRFAAQLPEPDTIGELGRSMGAFFAAPSSSGAADLDYAGTFDVEDSQEEPGQDRPEMTIEAAGGFWRILERKSGDGHLIYDGVLVRAGATALAAERDRLMSFPKLYMLCNTQAEGIFGCVLSIDFDGLPKVRYVKLIGRSDGF
ncbi:MAG: hypothetical protein WC806_02520 [Candidatus Gracilibacteria bacterium]